MRRLLVLVVLTACTVGDATTDSGNVNDDIDNPDGGFAPHLAGKTVRVVQMNSFYGAQYAPEDITSGSCSATLDCETQTHNACTATSGDGCFACIAGRCRQRNWQTAKNAANLFDAIHADVVGIEELAPQNAPRIAQIFGAATGTTWQFRDHTQGINDRGSGIGVFWRSDKIDLVADLGSYAVGTLDSGYIIRFQGVILSPRGSGKQFGMFAGKLDWLANEPGHRHGEAQRLRAWMDEQMAAHPEAKARVLASDFNDTIGSSAYDVFADYDDGDATKPTIPATSPSRRIDYLFWADSANGASKNGFVSQRSDHRLGRSMYYGSDHRFVYGDALIP